MAAPSPCSVRAVTSMAGVTARPQAREAAVKTAVPQTKTRPKPYRWPSRAPVTSPAA